MASSPVLLPHNLLTTELEARVSMLLPFLFLCERIVWMSFFDSLLWLCKMISDLDYHKLTHWVSWVFQLPSPFHTPQSWFLLILSIRFTNLGLARSRLMGLCWEPLNIRGHTQFISWTKDQLCTLASALGMVSAALFRIGASGRLVRDTGNKT